MEKTKKLPYFHIVTTLLILLSMILLEVNFSMTAQADMIELEPIIEFSESYDAFSLSCQNITNYNRDSLNSKIIDKLENENTLYDVSHYMEYVAEYIDLSSVEDSFIISTTNYSVSESTGEIVPLASSNDVSIVNTVTRKESADRDGYNAYRCEAFCKWSNAPVNRFKDIFAISVESDTTPLFESLYGYMRCIFNASGQSLQESLGDERVTEYSIPGAVGVKFDLPMNVLLGGIIYTKMEFTVAVTVLTKSDFNMYSGYAHRVIAGSPTISTTGPGFSVNFGTDLFTGNVISTVI